MPIDRSPGANETWVAFDVDRIKEFVFSSSRPIDVTGASELVKDLAEGGELLKRLVNGSCEVIYANGGSGLLRVRDDQEKAQEIALKIEQEFREHSLSGSCTAIVFQPHWEIETPEGFQRLIRVLGAMLQQRKAEKAGEEFPEPWVMSYTQHCEACGLYSAIKSRAIGVEPEEEREWVCRSCDQKRERGKSAKYGSGLEMPKMARRLDEIAGEDRYLAVIYADANRAGQLARQAGDQEQLKAFSQTLWKTVEQAVVKTARTLGLQNHYQSPVIGGDDVLLFVPAAKALAALREVHNQVTRGLAAIPKELQGIPLGQELAQVSFSYALLVAPHHLPIPYLYRYAQALLDSSKQRAYQTEGESIVDFHWITEGAPLSVSLSSLRETFYAYQVKSTTRFPYGGRSQPLNRYWVTSKPYSWEEFEELDSQVKVFKQAGVTKGQLRRLAQIIQSSNPLEARLNVLYQAARTDQLTKALKKVSGSPERWPEFFFSLQIEDGEQVLRTKVLDLLELFELQGLAKEEVAL